jgi:hypothetical protein
MKLQNKLFSIQSFIIFATANLVLVSCGTYQTAYYEDGIYSAPEKREKQQIVVVERTNNNNLNGIDTITGGSIIIPIAIKTDATTISNTKNGI